MGRIVFGVLDGVVVVVVVLLRDGRIEFETVLLLDDDANVTARCFCIVVPNCTFCRLGTAALRFEMSPKARRRDCVPGVLTEDLEAATL